jgi:hypothetical protein
LGLGVEARQIKVKITFLTEEEERKIDLMWVKEDNQGGLKIRSLQIELKQLGEIICRRQYPIPTEGKRGLKAVIE